MTDAKKAEEARQDELRARILRQFNAVVRAECRDHIDQASAGATALALAASLCAAYLMPRTSFVACADQMYRGVVATPVFSDAEKAALLGDDVEENPAA